MTIPIATFCCLLLSFPSIVTGRTYPLLLVRSLDPLLSFFVPFFFFFVVALGFVFPDLSCVSWGLFFWFFQVSCKTHTPPPSSTFSSTPVPPHHPFPTQNPPSKWPFLRFPFPFPSTSPDLFVPWVTLQFLVPIFPSSSPLSFFWQRPFD